MTGDGVKELVVVTTRGVQVNEKQNKFKKMRTVFSHFISLLSGVNILGVASRPKLGQRSYN